MLNAILSHLPQEHPWRKRIHCYETTDSTNLRAKALAISGAPEGTVVIANHQTQGRGRLGRQFHSPKNSGLYLSLLLRPNCPPSALMHLTCAAGVCACDAVEETAGFRPGIKWINDLVAGTKKLGGILTELSIHPQTHLVDWAIIGIGINCTQQEADFPPDLRSIACSLSMTVGTPVNPSRLAAALIRRFSQLDFLSNKSELMNRYRKDCVTLGRSITVVHGPTQYHASALSLDEDGGLIIRRDDGATETLSAGEVQVRGLYGYV